MEIALLVIAAIIAIAPMLLNVWRCGLINPVSLFNAVYLVFALGKAIYIVSGGHLNRAPISEPTTITTLLFLSVAMAVLNLSYTAIFQKDDARPLAREPDLSALPITSLAVIFPFFLVVFLFVANAYGVDIKHLFTHRDIVDADGRVETIPYLGWKLTNVVKFPFYAVLAAYAGGYRISRLAFVVGAVSFAAGVILHLIFAQRSGITLMLMDAALLLAIYRRLKWQILAIAIVVFIAANFIVISSRMPHLIWWVYLEAIFGRSYFFDVVKIERILDYATPGALQQGVGALLAAFYHAPFVVSGELHHFIAHEVFGLNNAIPPSMIGEVILNNGPGYVAPALIMLGALMAGLMVLAKKTKFPPVQLIAIVTVSRLAFFCANSNIDGAINRIAMDVLILVGGFLLLWIWPKIWSKNWLKWGG